MKERKLRSFVKRLTRWIALSQLVVMGAASFGIYTLVKRFVIMEENDLYKSYLVTTTVSVSKTLKEVSAGANNHVSEIEANLSHPDRMVNIMKRVVAQNPSIRSCGVSFVAGYYPQKGRWFCPYAYRDSTGRVRRRILGSARYDYLKAPWFVEALEADSCYWSKPFFEHGDTLNPQVSYLVPIHDAKGAMVGVLGVDLSLTWLSRRLSSGADVYSDGNTVKVNRPDGGYSRGFQSELGRGWRIVSTNFIIDSDGVFIAHPDTALLLRQNYFDLARMTKDSIDDYVGRQMVAGRRGMYCDVNGIPQPFDLLDGDGLASYVYYSPVEDTNWSLALVVPWLMIDGIGMAFGLALLLLVGLALLVVRIVGGIIIRRFAKPIQQLADSAKEVAKGNFNAPLPQIKHNDEIKLLRDSFEGMQHSLAEYVEELKKSTASKAAIESELKVAHDIQMSMLPKIFPPYPERSDIDIFGSLSPAKDVGGDLFDFYIRDEKLFFCIGDVSGKGIPASLVMAVTHSLFRNISTHEADPQHIVESLNRALSDGNDTSMFVTAFVGVLDLSTGCLHYCNAGHNPPLILGREVSLLPCESNVVLGLADGITFTPQEVTLEPHTTMFLFTDGLNEAEDTSYAQFGDDRIAGQLEALLAEGNTRPDAIVGRMTEAVHAFVGQAEQSDDLTMLAICYRP